jgi:hypothetical protein
MTREDIRALPDREFEDFLTFIDLEIREENARNARAGGANNGNRR